MTSRTLILDFVVGGGLGFTKRERGVRRPPLKGFPSQGLIETTQLEIRKPIKSGTRVPLTEAIKSNIANTVRYLYKNNSHRSVTLSQR